jgi:hypothetical protein
MWLSTDSTTVVDVSFLTRTLDVDFNVLTGVVEFSILTRTLDMDFNSLNYRGVRLFIASDVGCGFQHPKLP